MARRDDRDVLFEQLFERGEIGAHIAVGRVDHHGRALHHVVAGEEHLRLLEQITQMVRGMARRVDRAQRDVADLEALAIVEHVVGLERRVLSRRCRPAEHLRAGRFLDRGSGGRMVEMRVRAEHPLDVADGEDLLDVRGDVGSGVDDRVILLSDDVGVGARTRHQPGVGGEDPPHERADRRRHADRQVRHVMSVRPHGEDDAIRRGAGLVVAGVAGQQDPHAPLVEHHARLHERRLAGGACGVEEVGGAVEAGDRLEALERREDEVEVATAVALERVGRARPEVRNRLTVVVQGRLLGRRGRHEEPRVVPARCALRRDPVAEVVDAVDGQLQVFVEADVDEPARALVDGNAVLGEAFLH